MAYEFDMPYLRGLLAKAKELEDEQQSQVLGALSNNNQPEPQEQIGGKEMVDRAMEPVVSPTPNSYERQLQRAIVEQKQAYADAQTDAARQQASSMAEFLRSQGNAGGMDLSGYGSDVSLADAYKNLYSQQAREIMGALQGQYSMNSNQYYEQQYARALVQGLSRKDAKAVAGKQAREYQANRVAYLNGVYNSYGHDGLVTNDIGNQIIGMMSMENPSLANFYATIYPNAKDAYRQQNELEQLGVANKNALERMGAQHNFNEISAANADIRARDRDLFNDTRDKARALWGANLADQLEDNKYVKQQGRVANTLRNVVGLDPSSDQYKSAYAKAMGIEIPQNKPIDNLEITKAQQNQFKALLDQEGNILKQLGNEFLSDEEKQNLQAQLGNVRREQQRLYAQINQGLGLGGQQPQQQTDENWVLPAISRDFNANARLAAEFYLHGGTDDDIRAYYGSKYSDEELDRLIKAARAGR